MFSFGTKEYAETLHKVEALVEDLLKATPSTDANGVSRARQGIKVEYMPKLYPGNRNERHINISGVDAQEVEDKVHLVRSIAHTFKLVVHTDLDQGELISYPNSSQREVILRWQFEMLQKRYWSGHHPSSESRQFPDLAGPGQSNH